MAEFAQCLVPTAELSRRTLWRALLAIGAVAEVLTVLPEPGIAAPDPQSVVNYVTSQGMAALAPNVPPAQRAAQMRQLFAQYFDTGHIAAFALGGYRRIATPQQQDEFNRLYEQYTVAVYTSQLARLGNATVRITGTRPYGKEIIVGSDIVRTEGNAIQVDWYVVNRHGKYKISDIVIAGNSMKLGQRNEFAQWIQTNGGRFDALLAVMRQEITRLS
jgi:phospholipid transport system substrate-binding protein